MTIENFFDKITFGDDFMGSILIYKGMPPLTEKEIAELERNKPKSDDEIDYSDIPPLTEEELLRMRLSRLRKQKQNIAS